MTIKRLSFKPNGNNKFLAMGIEDTTYEIESTENGFHAVVSSMEAQIRNEKECDDLDDAINWLNAQHAKIILEWIEPEYCAFKITE